MDLNYSFNGSTIRLNESRAVSQGPAIMNIGRGYYSSHPVDYGSTIGSQTWIKDANSAASMHHEVNYAHGIDGEIELSGSESSYRQDGHYSQSTASIQMRVNEDITDGSTHIGALQGSGEAPSNGRASDPLMNAWKNPSLEIEEDYIGTYHIEKKMSIITNKTDDWKGEGWLNCCNGDFFNIGGHKGRAIGADDVFDYRFAGA